MGDKAKEKAKKLKGGTYAEEPKKKKKKKKQKKEDEEKQTSQDVKNGDDGAGLGCSSDDEVTSLMQGFFQRYDLYSSGTINSSEELNQLCTNLCFQLQAKGMCSFTLSEINKIVDSAGTLEEEESAMDLDKFSTWFRHEFLTPSKDVAIEP